MGGTRRGGGHFYVAAVVENDNALERLRWEKETLNGKLKVGLSAAQAVTQPHTAFVMIFSGTFQEAEQSLKTPQKSRSLTLNPRFG